MGERERGGERGGRERGGERGERRKRRVAKCKRILAVSLYFLFNFFEVHEHFLVFLFLVFQKEPKRLYLPKRKEESEEVCHHLVQLFLYRYTYFCCSESPPVEERARLYCDRPFISSSIFLI